MPVTKVYVRGEPRLTNRPKGKRSDLSGVNVTVSRADFTNLERQIRDALAFLKKHKRDIRRAGRAVGVEQMTLDFGIARRDVAAQFDYFPPELVSAAGQLGLGLELSQYPSGG
jgi:hypothetical protein